MTWLLGIAGSIIGRFKVWLALIGAVLTAIAIAFLKGREAGKEIIRDEQQRARAKAIAAKKESDDAVDAMGPADVDRVFSRWLRDK